MQSWQATTFPFPGGALLLPPPPASPLRPRSRSSTCRPRLHRREDLRRRSAIQVRDIPPHIRKSAEFRPRRRAACSDRKARGPRETSAETSTSCCRARQAGNIFGESTPRKKWKVKEELRG